MILDGPANSAHAANATLAAYDSIAEAYAERLHRHLDDKPFDTAALHAFCSSIMRTERRHVLDAGCGTGYTTSLLARSGLDPVGLDSSEGMIGLARRLNPELRFEVGSILHLDRPDASVDGVLAWYSTVHFADDTLPRVFAELRRVLRPGGPMLVAFQVGEGSVRRLELLGHPVDLTFYRRSPSTVSALLADALFRPEAQLIREPDPDGIESTPQAYLFVRAV